MASKTNTPAARKPQAPRGKAGANAQPAAPQPPAPPTPPDTNEPANAPASAVEKMAALGISTARRDAQGVISTCKECGGPVHRTAITNEVGRVASWNYFCGGCGIESGDLSAIATSLG